MQLGRHLLRLEGVWIMRFSEAETKNGLSLELPLCAELTEPLERYLGYWRPILLGSRASEHIWISGRGRVLRSNELYVTVVRRTRELLGVPMYPHLFRACLATEIAIRDPAHAGIASPLLGHRASRTTQHHYNFACQHEAARMLQTAILDMRRKARRQKGHSGRMRRARLFTPAIPLTTSARPRSRTRCGCAGH
jgi:integrase